MATFAEIDDNNIVLRTVKVDDAEAPDTNTGEQYCRNLFGGNWRQCSWNTVGNVNGAGGTPFRKNMPAQGWTWDEAKDGFIEPQPHDSWTLNDDTGLWEAPVAKHALTAEQNAKNTKPDAATPSTHMWGYDWNEDTQSWDLTVKSQD